MVISTGVVSAGGSEDGRGVAWADVVGAAVGAVVCAGVGAGAVVATVVSGPVVSGTVGGTNSPSAATSNRRISCFDVDPPTSATDTPIS